MKIVNFIGIACEAEFPLYQNGGKAIQLYSVQDGLPVATGSVWIPGLQEGEVAIKDYSENTGMLDSLLEAGIVDLPHRHASVNGMSVPVCKLLD